MVWLTTFKKKNTDRFTRALKFISIGTVIFFFLSSFSKKIEANWTIFLAVPLVIVSMRSEIWEKKWARGLVWASFAICLLARLVFVFEPSQINVKRLGEFKGWNEWAKSIEEKCAGRVIMANSYQIAAKLSFYLNRDVTALNYHSRKNQFDFWRFDRPYQEKPICFVTNKSQFTGEIILTPENKELQLVKFEGLPEEIRSVIGR